MTPRRRCTDGEPSLDYAAGVIALAAVLTLVFALPVLFLLS